MRETSIQAYRQIKQEGLLSKMRERVYDVVFHHGPCTSAEAYTLMTKVEKAPITQSRARFTELRDQGVFKECGRKTCSVTGRTAILWDVTDQLPSQLPKKKKKNGLQDAIDYMIEKEIMFISITELREFL